MSKFDKILDNGKSHIRIYNNRSVKIIDNSTDKKSDKAIAIMPTLQIEFGRCIEDVVESISKTKMPIIIEEFLNVGSNFKYYSVTRLSTGNVPEYTICKIGANNGRITEVIFENTLASNRIAKKYRCVSAIASVAIVESDISSIEMDSINTISLLTDYRAYKYKCDIVGYKIYVEADYREYIIRYTYIRNKDNEKKYSLIGVNYITNR